MPVTIERLRELIELASAEGVESISLVEGGTRISITRNGTPTNRKAGVPALPTAVSAALAVDPDIFAAPMFGILHLTPAPDGEPYVRIGQAVTKGQQLCLIEAMKMFSAIHSDRDGRIDAILAEAGRDVACGQPLFRIVGT